jgi:anaerobic selenocysteine-containing dehydrogenase
LERTAQRTGLAPSDIQDLVQSIRHAKTISVCSGTGSRMGPYPTTTQFLLLALSVITGSFDKPGGSPASGRGVIFAPEGAVAEAPGPRSRPELRMWAGQMPCSAMADEIEAGNLRAVLSFGGNIMTAVPGSTRLGRALASLEVFAVHDIVPTASTDLATHVLPGTSELEDGSLVAGLTYAGRMFRQYAPAVFAPIADRKPTWFYVDELGRRLGLSVFPEGVTEDSVHEPVFGRVGQVSDLASAPDGMVVGDEIPFGGFVDTLPEGRWNLAPEDLIDEIVHAQEPPDLVLIPRRQIRHLNSFMVDMPGPSGKVDHPDVLIHPEDARSAGVEDGAGTVVRTISGELLLRARVTDDIARGAVSVPHGYRDANVELLLSCGDGVDPISGMPRQAGVAVAIEPATIVGG